MAKKREFHCQQCNSVLTIYRKGKKHRVLVCPEHGVLATNPFSFGRAATGAATGGAVGTAVPVIGNIAGAVAGGLIGGFSGKEKSSPRAEGVSARPQTHRLNALDWADRALSTR